MLIIGLTGGIACGKSAVAQELEKLGAKTLDIDKITHKLLAPGGQLFDIYVAHFGEDIIDWEGNLDRAEIAEIIFNNEDERGWINSVAHPILLNCARDFLIDCQNNGVALVVLEVPLLFEVGWEFLFDEIWAIHVSPSTQIWRILQRDKITKTQALARINAQMPVNEICARADFVINNRSSKRSKVQRQIRERLKGRFLGGMSLD